MKFSTSVAATVLALPFLAAATPVLETRDSCNTGSIQCCQSVQSATDPLTTLLLGLLGIVLGPITGEVGLTCSPITVIGVGSGNACSASPVCCSNTQAGGLIGIGCVPISL